MGPDKKRQAWAKKVGFITNGTQHTSVQIWLFYSHKCHHKILNY